MPERRYREVQARSEWRLLPPGMDAYVSEHNPVCAIKAFVGTLELEELGFRHAEEPYGASRPMIRDCCGSFPCPAINPGCAVRAGWKRSRAGTWR